MLTKTGMDAQTRPSSDYDVEEENIGGEPGSATKELYEQHPQKASDVPTITHSTKEITTFVDETPDPSVPLPDPHHNVYLTLLKYLGELKCYLSVILTMFLMF